MFGVIRFALFTVLLLLMVFFLYLRKTVGDPFVISKQKLEEISESAALRRLNDATDTLKNKEMKNENE